MVRNEYDSTVYIQWDTFLFVTVNEHKYNKKTQQIINKAN